MVNLQTESIAIRRIGWHVTVSGVVACVCVIPRAAAQWSVSSGE